MRGSGPTLAGAQRAFVEEFVPRNAGRIRVVATDVDGTLTAPNGRLTAVGLDALARLREHDTTPTLILVTGRPAAAVQGLLIYSGFTDGIIIAENGAVVIPRPGSAPHLLARFKDAHGNALRAYLHEAGLPLREAEDNANRFSDITFVPEDGARSYDAMQRLAATLSATLERAPAHYGLPPMTVCFSTVHVHVGPAGFDKGSALRAVLTGEIDGGGGVPVSPDSLVCLGDSANDRALFEAYPDRAVAVPGAEATLDPILASLARYAAPDVADRGFAEVVRALFPAADGRQTPC